MSNRADVLLKWMREKLHGTDSLRSSALPFYSGRRLQPA